MSDPFKILNTGPRDYISKLNFYEWAKNEIIVVSFRGAKIAVGEPVTVYTQWTKSAGGVPNQNVTYNGYIWGLEENAEGFHIKFIKDYYYFEGTYTKDGHLKNVRMKNDAQHQESKPMDFTQSYPPHH